MNVYLDYNASAPLCAAAREALLRTLDGECGNASSIHRFGQRAKSVLDTARDQVARLVGGEASEIVFTGSGTEADNLALRGAAAAAPPNRRTLVLSGVEHEAVRHTASALEREGWRLVTIPAGPDGAVDANRLLAAVDQTTALVSLMLANNETGVLQPVAACGPSIRERGAVFHVDAVQAAGKVPVDVRALSCDLLSLSAHKFGGPQGVGALWVRRGVSLKPHSTGGRQERGRRAGTENVVGIAAMGAAAEWALAGLATTSLVAAHRDALEAGLLARLPGVHVNGDTTRRVPNTSNISIDGVEGESLVIALDLDGIAASTGSACSSGTLEPSHVLRAMGLPSARVQSAIRLSLGPGTTAAEIEYVLDVLPARVERLRRLHRSRT